LINLRPGNLLGETPNGQMPEALNGLSRKFDS
jgi:hypothetical protein